MPAPSEKELLYYIGWIDRRTDPWPSHETLTGPGADLQLDGKPIEFLPPSHTDWPGLPFVRGAKPVTFTDGRMGRFTWPGIPIGDDNRVYAGPTIAALLHPRSEAHLKRLRKAFLLYQPDIEGIPHQQLESAVLNVAKARGITKPRERIELAAVPGITDPTDFRSIIDAVRAWLKGRDPFELSVDRPTARRVIVNLSPGTTAMAASWLVLFWSGALGGTRCTIEFVQGDGGLSGTDRPDNPAHHPLKLVPVDVLSEVKTIAVTAPPPPAKSKAVRLPAEAVKAVPEVATQTLDAEILAGRPYDRLRQGLERAALVGMPVVLEGERGTGKTFLAEFYHQRRQEYRWGLQSGGPILRTPHSDPNCGRGKNERPPVGPPWKGGARRLIKVTLSEFSSLDRLTSSLFGWARRSFTGGKDEDDDGLLGEAHEGTLFLDEIHQLPWDVQKSLLGPLNLDPNRTRAYSPAEAKYEVESDFDLICATNEPGWRDKLIPDLQNRLATAIVLRVPALRDYQADDSEVLWRCWEVTLAALCKSRGIADPADAPERPAACRVISEFLRTDNLPGNWRDLQTLAVYVLFLMTDARGGRPLARLQWSAEQTDEAVRRAKANRPAVAPQQWGPAP